MTLGDKDWQRLIDKIRRREVIPLIGPGVVTTPVDGVERLLLQAAVPELLAELDQVDLDRTREYADVRAVAREYAGESGGFAARLSYGAGDVSGAGGGVVGFGVDHGFSAVFEQHAGWAVGECAGAGA